MPKDLRSFLDEIRGDPNDFVEVERSVRPQDCEVTALLKNLDRDQRYPTVLFRSPMDMYGNPSQFSLISNIFATRQRCAVALGLDPKDRFRELSLAYAEKARGVIAPEIISNNAAPLFENVLQGDQVDVGLLPIVKHFEMDMGPVLTMAHALRSHEGFYDLSFVKTFYKESRDRMVVSIHTPHLSRILGEYTKAEEPTPIINVLGHHPAFYMGSLARNPYGVNDYETIGSFLDEPLRMTPSATWGDRILVPADAEIVIEGEIPAGERDLCDPFGEVAGLYQAQCLRPVMNIKAITFRNGAIMQDIFSGFRDSFVGFHCVIKEAALEDELRPEFPMIHEIAMPTSGMGIHCAYISVHNSDPAMIEALGRRAIEIARTHAVIVVDDVIDVFNEDDVMFAVHTFLDPSTHANLFNVAGHLAGDVGVNVPKAGFGTTNWDDYKLVLNATRPTDFAFGQHNNIAKDLLQRIQIEDYIPVEKKKG